MTKQNKSGGGAKKHGRSGREPKHKKYTSLHQHDKNKVKRILQSNGEEAAMEYALRNGVSTYLRKLITAKWSE